MRLTLRTLLAYLDDVLEPAQTKLIGQKIQESAVAGKLVSLIRLVVRQRRLKAPSVSGPNVGIDPNVVAQYLDNTLTPDQVVEVEKVLLTSDELLAEVASCHQVLALMLGKASEVPQSSRDRLYALGPVAQQDQLRVDDPPATNHAPAQTAAQNELEKIADSQLPDSTRPTVPDYLRQPSWSQRVFPTAIVAVLAIVCVGLLLSDAGFRTGLREAKRALAPERVAASNDRAPSDRPAEPSGTAPAVPATPVSDGTVPADAVAVTNRPSQPMPALPADLDPKPRPDEPEPEPADRPADAVAVINRPVPPGTPAVAPAVPKTNPDAPKPVPVAPVLVRDPVVVQYLSNDGLVARLDAMQNHWFLLPRRSAVTPPELIAVLDPFEAILDVDRGAVIATVLSDSALRVLPPDEHTATGFDIHHGRILLRSGRKEGAPPSELMIQIGDSQWILELTTADAACTLEVAPREPVQFEKTFQPAWYTAVLRVVSGTVKWTVVGGKSQQVNKESALEITQPPSGDDMGPLPVSSTYAPDWADPQKRKLAPLRRFAALFEKQFEADQPVEMALLALIKDSNAKIVELAVRGLASTDSYASLAQALAECSFEEGRFAARDGLRAWLARDAARGAVLKAILEQRYPPTEANAIYIMLWGYKPEDAMSRTASIELVNWLRSPHVEIRELAYHWIVLLTNRKWDFRATDVPGRREAAVRRIENHVTSAGALLKPPEKPASPQ